MKYRVLLEKDEGWFVAEIPSLPGCVSQGQTKEEALRNIRDAIDGYLASLAKHNEHVTPPANTELVEVYA